MHVCTVVLASYLREILCILYVKLKLIACVKTMKRYNSVQSTVISWALLFHFM